MSKTILPIFSSRSFIISDLTFRSWVYFLHGMKTYSNLILLHVVCNYNVSNCIMHFCLLILYLFYVLGNCINCVNCFLHFLHSIFKSSEHLYYHYSEFSLRRLLISSSFIWSCEFLPCPFICVVFLCLFIIFFFFFLTCSTWGLLFPGFRVVLFLPFDFCPCREMLVGWLVLISCWGWLVSVF